MDSGFFVSPPAIIIGLILVIGLGLVIYLFGAAVIGRMHQARLQEETEGSGMQTGDPVNPVLDPEETLSPSSARESEEEKPSPL